MSRKDVILLYQRNSGLVEHGKPGGPVTSSPTVAVDIQNKMQLPLEIDLWSVLYSPPQCLKLGFEEDKLILDLCLSLMYALSVAVGVVKVYDLQ